MKQQLIREVNREKILLENIFAVMAGYTFSKTQAEEIVGRGKLERLIEKGDIECEKRSGGQNGKWFCNAEQVLRHCRDMRPLQK